MEPTVQSLIEENNLLRAKIDGLLVENDRIQLFLRASNCGIGELNENDIEIKEGQITLITDNIPVLIAHIDCNLQFIFANQHYAKWYKSSKSAIVGKNMKDLLDSSEFELIFPFLKRVLSGETLKAEYPSINSNGEPCVLSIMYVPQYEKKGKIIAFYSIMQDITEKKVAEQSLKESEEKYRSLAEKSNALICEVDSNGVFLFVNSAYKDILGYELEDLIGKHVIEIAHPDEKPKEEEKFEDALKTVNTQKNEWQFIDKWGKWHWMECHSRTYFLSTGEPRVNVVAFDITSKKEYEVALIKAKNKAEESDRLKSAFLYNMSHEIRTPLNAIMGYSKLIDNELISPAKRSKFAKIIIQRGADLLNLVNDILDISKIESGQMTSLETASDIGELFNEVYQYFLIQKNENVKWIINSGLTPQQKRVFTDSDHLRRILLNLVGNAFKFTKSGFIELGCSLRDQTVLQFYVKDSGIGIPGEKCEVIFERFRQANDAYLSREYGGNGLGLSISKSLVELLGGKIWVESKVGEGSDFYFTLPFKPAGAFYDKVESESKSEFSWSEKTILVVEDDPYNMEYLCEVLLETKAVILCANSGQQALDICISKQDIDLILMDIRLPDINGYEITRQLKAKFPMLPIIAQTAYAGEFDKQHSFDVGCNSFLPKPIEPNLLLNLIQFHFDNALDF